MKLIDGMIHELKEYSTEFNTGEISKEELNLKVQLIISRIDRIQLDYSNSPFVYLPASVLNVFTNLTRQYKAKGKLALKTLMETSSKASYNKKARYLIEKKLFFLSLHNTIQKNIEGWTARNSKKYPVVDSFFVLEEVLQNTLEKENDSNE